MATTTYDLVILGGGTGGYVTAIQAAHQGLKTAIVEKANLGGTCLHKGCIPTKALLKSAAVFQEVQHAGEFGVETTGSIFSFKKAIQRKNKIVQTLHNGVKHLVKKNQIDVYNGYGRILGSSIFSPVAGSISVEYSSDKENDILIPKNVIIATGSSPAALPGMKVDGEFVITSDELLELDHLPDSILIVGGGVIGLEWASFLHDVGVRVTIIEALDRILPDFDAEIVHTFKQTFKRKGIEIIEQAVIDPTAVEAGEHIKVTYNRKGQQLTATADKILLAVGRKANTSDMGLENTEIELDEKEFIRVNEFYQTNESHIYAIGDVIGGRQLAHVATLEGRKAVEHITGKSGSVIRETEIPSCIYGSPEIAMIGMTEEEAASKGFSVKKETVAFPSIGKAHVNGNTEGFIKMLIDRTTDDILGIHMIGNQVTELVGQASMAKYFDGSSLELSEAVYPHPSLSEVFGEVSSAIQGRKIHG